MGLPYMCMKNKTIKRNKLAEKARKDKELETYGKLLSLRPGKVHKSKKDYDRKKNKKIDYYED